MPLPSYSEGRRLNAKEIAEYYATAVRYLHVKERIWGKRPRPDHGPETVTALAVTMKLATKPDLARRRLVERVEWVIEHLPNPSICNAHWAKKVRLLGEVRQYLGAERV